MTALTNPTSGNALSDIITWVRRIIKSSSNQSITDATIGDYINRFYQYDMPERVQLFELKRQFTFSTAPNIFEYQMPFIGTTSTPQFQLLQDPVYCDGVKIGMFYSNEAFYNIFPEMVNNQTPLAGNGTGGPYTTTVASFPLLRAYKDHLGNLVPYVIVTASDSNGNAMYICDNGTLNASGLGILDQRDFTFQTVIASSIGTVNYTTGVVTATFNAAVPSTNNVEIQTSPFSAGTPRICLFLNNTIKLYPVPDRFYKMQFDTYVTPSQYLNTSDATSFSYMSEYIARGAARKLLSDNGDYEQFQFYEPLFKEQENLVLRRTTRQNSKQRTSTIYSQQLSNSPSIYTQTR